MRLFAKAGARLTELQRNRAEAMDDLPETWKSVAQRVNESEVGIPCQAAGDFRQLTANFRCALPLPREHSGQSEKNELAVRSAVFKRLSPAA